MKSYSVHNFFSFLKLAFRTLHKSGLWSHIVVITTPSERASKLGNFSASLVNCNDISGLNLLLGNRFNHFGAQIVNCLHFSCLKSNFASLCSTWNWFVNLNLNNFTFNDFCFFSNAYTCKKRSSNQTSWKVLTLSVVTLWTYKMRTYKLIYFQDW